MTFTSPPTVPTTASPADFDTNADAFLSWMSTFATELDGQMATINEAIDSSATATVAANAAVAATTYSATSTSSINTASGSAQNATIASGKSFAANDQITLIRRSDATIRAYATVNSYASTTLNFTINSTSGTTGTYTDWFIVASALAGAALAAASDVRAGTDTAKALTAASLVLAAAEQTLTDGATVNWNMASGFNAKVTLGGNRTLAAPTNHKEGLTYVLRVIQDATGSRTITWNACYDFGLVGAPTLSTTAAKIDLIFMYCYDAATPKFRCSYSKSA